MGRRDDTTDLIVRCLDAGRSVVLRAPAGMGKTTTIRDVVERRSVATLHASPSLSAKGIAFGAFAAIVPLPHGDSTSRVSAAISHLRSDDRLLVVDDCQLLDDESATVLHLLASERPPPSGRSSGRFLPRWHPPTDERRVRRRRRTRVVDDGGTHRAGREVRR